MRPRKELDTTTFDGRFATRLLELRIAAGLSQDEAAGKIGVQVGAIYDWENGRTQPPMVRLPIITDTYGVSIKEFFEIF